MGDFLAAENVGKKTPCVGQTQTSAEFALAEPFVILLASGLVVGKIAPEIIIGVYYREFCFHNDKSILHNQCRRCAFYIVHSYR